HEPPGARTAESARTNAGELADSAVRAPPTVIRHSSFLIAMQFSFLIPTRHNVAGLEKLLSSIVETTADPHDLEIVLAIDEDDLASQKVTHDQLHLDKVVVPKGYTMGALNNACLDASTGRYIMLMNDDVVLRTKDWDRRVREVFAGFKDDIALLHVN